MRNQAERLSELRTLIGNIEFKREKKECLPFSLLPQGIPKGALIEIIGRGKTELVSRFLAENPQPLKAWIEEDFSVYPCALIQKKVCLEKILFIEAGSNIFWAVLQVLRSQLFSIIILSCKNFHEKALRKLQLAAEKAHSALILLSEVASKPWPLTIQMQVERQSSVQGLEFQGLAFQDLELHIDILRCR